MSEAAGEEASVLASIYCGEGEFQLLQSASNGLCVQINSTALGPGRDLGLLFHLPPQYPSCPPDISVSSTALSRAQCHNIRQKLLEQAAALPPEPMVHKLVEFLQTCEELKEGKNSKGEEEDVERWTVVLSLDHIRSRNHYIGLLERWCRQLQLSGIILLGRHILVILQGTRADIKEFCHLLKAVKVDVDSSGKKCKERMMKILSKAPSSGPSGDNLLRFVVRDYKTQSELSAAFQEFHMTELYKMILPSLD